MTTESMLTSEAPNTTDGPTTSQAAPTTDAATQTAASTEQRQQQQQGGKGDETANAKADADKSDADKGDEGAKPGAPEKYEFKAPEGQAFDNTVIEQFSDVAKELNLPQDAAQKILDKVAPVIQAQQAKMLESVRNEWAESARGDKEFGGEKLTENLAVAKKALDQFGSPELRALLNESGLGNHPELIRMMYRAGKAISEDSFVGKGNGDQRAATNDPASRLYPSQQSK